MFSSGSSSFASKPTTPTGLGGGFPPLSSPQKASPQPMGSGWQQGGGYSWQQSQSKPQPSMPHSSPQNRPNYNVSFSSVPTSQSERGKGSTNLGKVVPSHVMACGYYQLPGFVHLKETKNKASGFHGNTVVVEVPEPPPLSVLPGAPRVCCDSKHVA